MAAQGSYPQILDFLGRLQHLPRLVVVDGMSAHAGGDGSRITMTLTATVLYKQQYAAMMDQVKDYGGSLAKFTATQNAVPVSRPVPSV